MTKITKTLLSAILLQLILVSALAAASAAITAPHELVSRRLLKEGPIPDLVFPYNLATYFAQLPNGPAPRSGGSTDQPPDPPP
ncbi:hypothetical protein OROGR_017569 [Orobanche gracilis]